MTRPDLNRRAAVCWGAGTLAMALLQQAAEGADPDDPGEISLRSFDSIEPERFAWGSIRWLMSSKLDPASEMTLGLVEIQAHQANPVHTHPNCAELLHVLSGTLEHRVGERWTSLKPGDTLRIPRGVVHGARTGDEPCRVLVVYDTGTRQMVPVATP